MGAEITKLRKRHDATGFDACFVTAPASDGPTRAGHSVGRFVEMEDQHRVFVDSHNDCVIRQLLFEKAQPWLAQVAVPRIVRFAFLVVEMRDYGDIEPGLGS